MIAGVVGASLAGGGLFLYKGGTNDIYVGPANLSASGTATSAAGLTVAASSTASGTVSTTPGAKKAAPVSYADIENQKPLPTRPAVIKALYATSWSASSLSQMNHLVDLAKSTEINAIVIDIKDFSGHVLYDIKNGDVERYGAKEVRIPRLNTLIKRLHDEGVYVIARQTMFQDPVLARARPDLALKNISGLASGTPMSKAPLWYDNKKLAWIDPLAKDAWDYNIAIARDAAARGFDEINFDYIRFASDGSLGNIGYPFYNPKTTLKRSAIKSFFRYLREGMGDIYISADLFGLTTVNYDDLGIGQSLEDAALYFDALSPMVYPSHYASGFNGYKNPAQFPYEVVKYSMDRAVGRLLPKPAKTTSATSSASASSSATTTLAVAPPPPPKYRAKLRPWLQDFDLGADYDAQKVRAEIAAAEEAAGGTALYEGWMLWDPRNIYTRGALRVE